MREFKDAGELKIFKDKLIQIYHNHSDVGSLLDTERDVSLENAMGELFIGIILCKRLQELSIPNLSSELQEIKVIPPVNYDLSNNVLHNFEKVIYKVEALIGEDFFSNLNFILEFDDWIEVFFPDDTHFMTDIYALLNDVSFSFKNLENDEIDRFLIEVMHHLGYSYNVIYYNSDKFSIKVLRALMENHRTGNIITLGDNKLNFTLEQAAYQTKYEKRSIFFDSVHNSILYAKIRLLFIGYINVHFSNINLNYTNSISLVGDYDCILLNTLDNPLLFKINKLLKSLIGKLSKNGELYLIVSDYNLLRYDYDIRKYLIDNNLISNIIYHNYFLNDDFGNIITIKKSKIDDAILFIDSNKLIDNNKIDYDSNAIKLILDICNSRFENQTSAKLIPLSKIKKFDYNLNKPLYIGLTSEGIDKIRSNKNYVEMSEFLIYYPFENENRGHKSQKIHSHKGIHIDIKFLNNDFINYDSIELKETVPIILKGQIIKKDIFIMSINDKESSFLFVKPDKTDIPIYYDNNNKQSIGFVINTKMINPQYLALQLQSEYFKKQVKAFDFNNRDLYYRSNFQQLKIYLPSLEEQEDIINQAKVIRLKKRKDELKEFEKALNLSDNPNEHIIILDKSIRTAVKQYLEYFTDYVETAKGEIVDLKVERVEKGLKLTIEEDNKSKQKDIRKYLEEYLGFIKEKISDISPVIENNQLTPIQKDMLILELKAEKRNLETKLDFYNFKVSSLSDEVERLQLENRKKSEWLDNTMDILPMVIKSNQPDSKEFLDKEVYYVEENLRKLIVSVLEKKAESDAYSEFIAIDEHTKGLIERGIKKKINKHPHLRVEKDFNTLLKKISVLNIGDYMSLMYSRRHDNWDYFESIFKAREELEFKINQLGRLRNTIRHDNPLSDTTINDGKAAIAYFRGVFDVFF